MKIYDLNMVRFEGIIRLIEVQPRSDDIDETGHADPKGCIYVHVSKDGKSKTFYYPSEQDISWTDSEEKAYEAAENILNDALYDVAKKIQELQMRQNELYTFKRNLAVK